MKGNSGAFLQFSGDYVLKECANAKDQYDWFVAAERVGLAEGVSLPYVELVTERSYKIEYIAGYSATMLTSTQDLQRLINLVERWRFQPVYNLGTWGGYLQRLERHVKESHSDEMRAAFDLVSKYELPSSFAHGDLTLENVLVRNNGEFVLIDPNYSQGLFQSWLLDYGKLLQSVHSDYHRVFNSSPGSDPTALLNYLRSYLESTGYWELSLIAEISHIIRLRKYRPENERLIVDQILQQLLSELV